MFVQRSFEILVLSGTLAAAVAGSMPHTPGSGLGWIGGNPPPCNTFEPFDGILPKRDCLGVTCPVTEIHLKKCPTPIPGSADALCQPGQGGRSACPEELNCYGDNDTIGGLCSTTN